MLNKLPPIERNLYSGMNSSDDAAGPLVLSEDQYVGEACANERARTSNVPLDGVKKVDLVICVHNALERVQSCLESVIDHTRQPYNLVLINDGSEEKTSLFLRSFSREHDSVLVENDEPLGYTRAANQGMSLSRSDYCLFLNSDTVVSSRWLEKLLECAESDAKIGIVGPLSNAAAYQSVPFTKNEAGQWLQNAVPEGMTPNQIDRIIDALAERKFPRVPFLNGFCLLVKREVILRIGQFDEVGFGRGYGEEIDYCLRARKAGIEAAVADHVYVFHARSASYGVDRRISLSIAARSTLDEKHGAPVLALARQSLFVNKELELIRARIAGAFEGLKTK